MWPFTSNDGCSNHHWGDEWESRDEYRVEIGSRVWELEEQQYQFCQHEGCLQIQERWETIETVGHNEVELGDNKSPIYVFIKGGDD